MYDLAFIIGLIALGYVAGTWVEKRHYRSIVQRETDLLSLPGVTFREVDYPPESIAESRLVTGSAVISIDYFKLFLAGLRNIFGGTVKSYESLLDRARREAVLRMKQEALNADIILNVRIETAAIGRNAHRKGVGCLEALAYGTAVTLNPLAKK
ncbi:MAG: heavy metal-binding domain-containing protein [Desulfobacterales bacterium]|jgi:uncharacterized protein YbjQ (UPF0145 family)